MPLSTGIPKEFVTIGDHVRAARIKRGMEQKELASQLAVHVASIVNWEKDHSFPAIGHCGKLIEFVGYDPFPQPTTFAEELLSFRRIRGLRMEDAAQLAGVDPCSWSSWERGEREITSSYFKKLVQLIRGI